MTSFSSRAALGYGRPIFSHEHEEFRRSVRGFFEREVEPNIVAWEHAGMFPRELFAEAAKLGMLCTGIPEEYGGMGGDFLHHTILHEEHGYSPAGAALEAGLCTDACAYGLLFAGTEEQKREWLPRLATGDVIAEIAMSEAHSGSDVRAIRTSARPDGSDFLLSGHKMWVSNALICDLVMVAARLEGPGDATDRDPIQLLLVEVDQPGVTISPPTELMVRGAGGVSQMFFDGVRVPKERVLGGVGGQGMRNLLKAVTNARLAVAARMMASCELALYLTVEFTGDRIAFGKRVLDYQNTRFKLAELLTQIEVGRTYLDQILKRNEAGDAQAHDAAVAKLWVSELEARVMDECVQLFGGAGYSNEYPISKMFTFARMHRLYLGTSEILKVMISRTFGDEPKG